MQSKIWDVNVNIIKSFNDSDLNERYAEAVFKIIKNKISPSYVESFIEKLNNEIMLKGDNNESSSDL